MSGDVPSLSPLHPPSPHHQSYLTKELMATKKLTISVMNAIKVAGVTAKPGRGAAAGMGRARARVVPPDALEPRL